MLRWEIGDTAFFKSMRNYYETYKYKNATIEDFKKICENISGKNLDYFFRQWIYDGTGIIKEECSWNTDKEDSDYLLRLNLNEVQNGYEDYKFLMEAEVKFEDNSSQFIKFEVDKREQISEFRFKKEPVAVIFDPNNRILGTFTEVKN